MKRLEKGHLAQRSIEEAGRRKTAKLLSIAAPEVPFTAITGRGVCRIGYRSSIEVLKIGLCS
jgi:hypothetical protein